MGTPPGNLPRNRPLTPDLLVESSPASDPIQEVIRQGLSAMAELAVCGKRVNRLNTWPGSRSATDAVFVKPGALQRGQSNGVPGFRFLSARWTFGTSDLKIGPPSALTSQRDDEQGTFTGGLSTLRERGGSAIASVLGHLFHHLSLSKLPPPFPRGQPFLPGPGRNRRRVGGGGHRSLAPGKTVGNPPCPSGSRHIGRAGSDFCRHQRARVSGRRALVAAGRLPSGI